MMKVNKISFKEVLNFHYIMIESVFFDVSRDITKLRARDLYEVVVDEDEARINYHLIEIKSE